MTDNRTTELREKLTERGVKWVAYEKECHLTLEGFFDTRWDANGVRWSYLEINGKATLSPVGRVEIELTPEQAIAATLGRPTCEYVIEDNMNESEGMGDVWLRCTNCDTCYDYYADDWLLKMPHCPKCGATVKGGAMMSDETTELFDVCGDDRFEMIGCAKDELFEFTNINDSPEEVAVLDSILFRCWQMGWLDQLRDTPEQAVAAPLYYEVNPDGLPVGLTISEDGTLLDWRGENYVKQSTLEGGTLTAEQVRDAIERHSAWVIGNNRCFHNGAYEAIADELNAELGSEINGDTSDGHHTFNELYHHRAVLFSVIVRDHRELAWKARKHHDGTMYDGMFIVGVETPKGQATYHYDLDPYWEMFDCEEREFAPEWDGHTPDDAIARIAELGSGTCTLNETDSYSNADEVVHVLECSACGETCEHVNGAYPRCPHCGAKAVER